MTPLNRIGSTTAALALLLLSTLTFTPTAKAVNGDWTAEYVPNIGDSARLLALDHDGERLGLAYKYSSTNGVGFSIRSSAGVWTQKNAAAVPAVNDLSDLHLTNSGAAKWVISGKKVTSSDLLAFNSIDDGATWSSATITTAISTFDIALISAGKIGAATCVGNAVKYYHSLDNGATWTGGFRLDDNRGNPATLSSGTQTSCGIASSNSGETVSLSPSGGGAAHVVYSLNLAPYEVFAVQSLGNDDQFWSVPYYNGGACPSGCNPVDGATASHLTYFKDGFSSTIGVASPKNGDFITTSRNDHSTCVTATTPNSLVFSASYLGTALTESSGAACNAYAPSSTFQGITTASCSAYESTDYDRISGNAAHVFIAGMGHTTLCGSSGFEIDLKPSLGGAWARTFDDPSQTKVFDVDMTPAKSFAAFIDTVGGAQIKVVSANTPTPTTATSNVAVSNLVGFDVDDSGAVAIARLSSGTNVQVFNGQTLAAGAVATDADCSGKLDGVSAYASATDVYTTYFECSNSGSHPANSMKIRSGTLSAPVIPATCSGFGGGDITTTFLGSINVPDTLREISSLGLFPIDFSDCNTHGFDHVLLSWSFTTTNGQAGVWAVTQTNDEPDISDSAFITYDGAGTSPAQMCSWTDTASHDHIGTVGGGGSKFYLPTVDAHNTDGLWYPDAGISLDYTLGGAYSTAVALNCAQYRGIIATTSSVAVICTVASNCPTGVGTGQAYWTPKVPAGFIYTRAATMSDSGQWAAYIDSATGIHVINATSGVETTVFAEPESGVFWDMRMDKSGSSLWIAYTDHIYRYDISAYTCGLNCTNAEVPLPTSSSSSTVGGFLGLTPGAFDVNGNGDATSGGMLMSLLLIIGMAAVCAGIIPGKNPTTMVWGAGVGALLGLGWTVFMGIMPPLITFILIVIGVVVLGFRFKGGLKESG